MMHEQLRIALRNVVVTKSQLESVEEWENSRVQEIMKTSKLSFNQLRNLPFGGIINKQASQKASERIAKFSKTISDQI